MWLDPWWRDTLDVIVAAATILATGIAAWAIIYSGIQSRKAAESQRKERVRTSDLANLKDILLLTVGIETGSQYTSRKAEGVALRLSLSEESRAALKLTDRYYSENSIVHGELVDEAVRIVPQTTSYVGDMAWTGGNTVNRAVRLEILQRMAVLVKAE